MYAGAAQIVCTAACRMCTHVFLMKVRRSRHLRGLSRCGLLGGPILDHLHAQHQPLAAHVADDVMLRLQRPQPLQQQTAHLRRKACQYLSFAILHKKLHR